MISIYSVAIASTAGIARHFFVSSDGTFENSIGWGPKGIEYRGTGADLTPEQLQRIQEYPEKFGEYNIHTNNCEMFAWYIVTGKRQSVQTQEKWHTTIGAMTVSVVQPVLTVRSMDGYKLKQVLVEKLNEDLEAARRLKVQEAQLNRDEFWRKRDQALC